jgi:hypothetical protein
MTPPRTDFRDVTPQDTFQLEPEPGSSDGVPIHVLPPPRAINVPTRKTFREILTSKETWLPVGRFLKKSVTVGAAIIAGTVSVTAEVISSLPWEALWRLGVKWFKLGVCVFLDILDCFVGRLLGFGILFDLGCALITAALWGKRGWWCLLEVVDITEQIDGFVPTCTIIALRAWND